MNGMISNAESKCKSIKAFEEALCAMPDADFSGGDLEHFFSEGLYARKLTIPQDTFVVGKIHLKGQINFLMRGSVIIATENGAAVHHAPHIVVGKPGIKRVAYAITETDWVTVSATDHTELDKIEEDVIAKGYDDPRLIAKVEELKCLGEW